jgi:hypothetical protein
MIRPTTENSIEKRQANTVMADENCHASLTVALQSSAELD